ncbi:MAG TPA: GNAT family protein [Roseiflexaceae bacterium]|nr:GNAT family protein [Roseiflexaceae bacterium]
MTQPAPSYEHQTARGAVLIRPTREGDAAAFRALRLEGLLRHPPVFGSDHDQSAALPDSHWRQRVADGAGGPSGVLYVAEAGGQLIGSSAVAREASPKLHHNGLLVGVYLRDEWRGLRLADALVEACIAWAAGQGMRALRLSVLTENITAIRCYVRCGFAVYGVDPEAIAWGGRYYDELLMIRRLEQNT